MIMLLALVCRDFLPLIDCAEQELVGQVIVAGTDHPAAIALIAKITSARSNPLLAGFRRFTAYSRASFKAQP